MATNYCVVFKKVEKRIFMVNTDHQEFARNIISQYRLNIGLNLTKNLTNFTNPTKIE